MMLGGAVAARRRQTAAIVRVAAAELPANRVYQRSSGVSLVPLSGTYTGAASAVSARVIDAVTSVEAKTWTTVAAAPTGNTWSGTLSVPQGGWYRIQYRLAAETTAIYTAVNQFGVGDIWMFAGQSQQARMSTLSSFPPTPDTRTVYFISGTTWTVPGVTAGTNGNGAITFLNRMRATTTVPQACIQVSVEGTAISDWEVSDAAYTTAISRLTSVGEIAGVLWHQGTSDVGVTTKANYKTRLAALKSGLQSAAAIQRFAVYPLMHQTTAADTDAQIQEIRQAHYEYIAENPGTVNLGWRPDISMADDVHQTASGSEQIGTTYAHSLLFSMGEVNTNSLGPIITGVTRAGPTVTLAVQHRSGTALKINAGTQATGFQVYPRGALQSDATALAISSIVLNTNTIDIALAADPSSAVDVYYQWGRFDQTSTVYDNTTFQELTTGNAMQPLMLPVQSAVEVGGFVNPALTFDGETGLIRYPATTGWNFPDADWTVGAWVSIKNPAGTASQYIISSGSYNGLQTFNLLVYETSSSGNGSVVECAVRGSGTGSIVTGPVLASNLDTAWKLWIVERVKATELINIYILPINGTRTLYKSLSVAGLGSITPPVLTALSTRAPPIAANDRWLNGSLHSVFKLDGLLTQANMEGLVGGNDLITNLNKSPAILTRLNTLTTPIPNSGTAANASASVIGGVTTTEGPVFEVPSNAVQFNETAMAYTMPDSASMTLPSGDWTLGFMLAMDDNAGTAAQYIWSTGGYGDPHSINILFWEASSTLTPEKITLCLDDNATSIDLQVTSTSSVTPTVNGSYYLWTFEKDSTLGKINFYYTPINGVRVLFHSHTLSAAVGVLNAPAAVSTIGGRWSGAAPAGRYFGGRLHLAFQMNGILSQFQTQDIARGRDMVTRLSLAPTWYHKFTSAATTLTDLSGNGNTATLSGGPAVVVPGPNFTPNA